MVSRATVQRALVGLELFTGVAGLVGGLLLIAHPDGSLLQADRSALTGSPFVDWREPGILLAGLVGGGFLVAGTWQHQRRPLAGVISALGGLGLIAFESAEWAWIGFQPLEAVFAFVGFCITYLALRLVLSSPIATAGSTAIDHPAQEVVDLVTSQHQEATHDPTARSLRNIPESHASGGTVMAPEITDFDTPSPLGPRLRETKR